MNGFNDLKEKLEAQGIRTQNLSKNADLTKSNLKAEKTKDESSEEKEKRLQAEMADFLKGSGIFKNAQKA